MTLSFHIQTPDIDTTGADLYIEINAQGLTYIILNGEICLALVVYHFNESDSDETAAGYIHQIVADQPVLKQSFKKVHIIYGYAPFMLVPHQFMNDKDNSLLLELVYGEANDRIMRTDFMYRHSIHNIYSIPAVIELVISRYFSFADYTHLFSLLPDIVKKPANQLYCIFNKGQLKLLLIKGGRVQFMQNYSYTTPEDVAYYLLHCCRSFEVNLNEISLQLSGMIDVSSPLYRELYKYFLQVRLESLPEQYQYPAEISEYPSHYFSHLFAIAACV